MNIKGCHLIYFFLLMLLSVACSTSEQVYIVEDINDTDILKYPPPAPVNPVSYSFIANSLNHLEEIDVNSVNLRNLSITIENTGEGIIKCPYLFGPQGWDLRGDSTAFKSLATNITQGDLTKEQKFFRAFEWAASHIFRAELGNVARHPDPYIYYHHAGNASRLLNHYGACMCGEFHDVINAIFAKIPDAGMYGCKYSMGGHTAGGAYWDGVWHDFNGTPDLQMLHYKMDGKTIASWAELKKDPSPIDSVNKYTSNKMGYGRCFNPDSIKCPLNKYEYPPQYYDSNYLINFKYSDLRPDEVMTMYFDMSGRFDSTSKGYDEYKGHSPRNWVDYGNVVYKYKPAFTNSLYEPFVVEQGNIQRTKNGLRAIDPSKPAYIVFASNHYPWYHVGANIKAWFKNGGNVYIAKNNTIPGRKNLGADTIYTNLVWAKLDPVIKEYESASITAKSCYWVKFEFSGRGAGLDSVEIASELQMSTYAMPGLMYGKNYIRFTAEDLGRSSAKITYNYDVSSPYYFYEPATSSTGKHIYHRVGGRLGHTFGNWKKAAFWPRLIDSTDVRVDITVRIFNVQNTSNIKCVRTLLDKKTLNWGYYWWYWDGKDDEGNLLPPGMYAYRIDAGGNEEFVHTAFLYLYPEGIWPVPNEQRKEPPPLLTLK